MADLFLSYAREDHERAGLLATALAQRGFSVWWDRTLVAGSRFDEVIEHELRTASCVVVLWSIHSVKSRWVRAEAEYAAEAGNLIPVLIEAEARKMIPLAMRAVQYVDSSRGEATENQTAAGAVASAASRVIARVSKGVPVTENAGDEHAQPARWRGRLSILSAAGLTIATIVVGGWFKIQHPAASTVRVLAPEAHSDRPDPTLRFAAAARQYKEDRGNEAVATLRSIAQDARFQRRHQVLALDAAAQILVELGKSDSARTVIETLLDLEPPLILVTPQQGSTELGRLYDNVRKELLSRSVRRPNHESVDVVMVLPFQQLSGGKDFAGMVTGVQDLLITDLASVRGVRVVDGLRRELAWATTTNWRGTLPNGASLSFRWPKPRKLTVAEMRRRYNPPSVISADEMRATVDTAGRVVASPADALGDLVPTERRAFYEPAEFENRLAGARLLGIRSGFLGVDHVLTGSFVADQGKVVISAWVFQVNSAVVDAVAVVRSPPDSVLQGIERLSRQLTSQLARTP